VYDGSLACRRGDRLGGEEDSVEIKAYGERKTGAKDHLLEEKGIVASHSDSTNLFRSRHTFVSLVIFDAKIVKFLSIRPDDVS